MIALYDPERMEMLRTNLNVSLDEEGSTTGQGFGVRQVEVMLTSSDFQKCEDVQQYFF